MNDPNWADRAAVITAGASILAVFGAAAALFFNARQIRLLGEQVSTRLGVAGAGR